MSCAKHLPGGLTSELIAMGRLDWREYVRRGALPHSSMNLLTVHIASLSSTPPEHFPDKRPVCPSPA